MPARVLTQDDIDAIAEATVERLARVVASQGPTFALVDARKLAAELGVSVDYVYSHASELGGMRLGSGPKARIRFDLDQARQALERQSARGPSRRR